MGRRLQVLTGHLLQPTGTAAVAAQRAEPDHGTTFGAPIPFAANSGRPFINFDLGGDAGVRAASAEALRQKSEGRVAAIAERYNEAPAGPIATEWGLGFKTYDECLLHMQKSGERLAPPGGICAPMRYAANEEPTYSHVPSNSLWKQNGICWDLWKDQFPEKAKAGFMGEINQTSQLNLWYPCTLRDARRIGEYYPGLSPYKAACMDRLGLGLVEHESACKDFYDPAEVEAVFYKECEQILLDFFPGATDAWVYDHNVFNKDAPRPENQAKRDPGVAGGYVDLAHSDLTDNSGPVRCRELLTRNVRCFSEPRIPLSGEAADAKMAKRYMSINMARPIETIEQNPFVLCAWTPEFAKQPYITSYRIYDDRVGETQRFTYRPDHEWYWFPLQRPSEISLLKCYDSVKDGSMSRWSLHSSCIDPTAPPDAPCRKSIVLRSFVFF